ncbi:bifunctional DNA primase/polymerase [Thalassobaculum litoreum]|uniref:Primase C terminal 1 (PriCT-1) n=1 Tax=Thalassobaculum litoreum DSM 18839 TaxID=1123362 RepID=A0A8G2BMV9_9PROT|nr:bifunctional DNA primase/polymerase [Thalassobaculum litoreum]SDG17430.1 Primase C terminal 1 (PriCT-1) [Thalassobaculum litoreum DSM 18839]
MTTRNLLDHALMFAGFGLAVFPVSRPIRTSTGLRCNCGRQNCPSPGKHPDGRLAPHGFKDASASSETLARWFGKGPTNIGIATGSVSGIFVLDVDERHDGFSSLATLEREHGALPQTWRFLTGGGGEHILFRHPEATVRNSAGALGRGLDVRGDGGYIVAPPSLHISGREYAISVDHHPDDVALSEAPAWLLRLLQAAPSAKSPAKPIVSWRETVRSGIADGSRNQTLTRIAGHLVGKSVDPHVCLELLLSLNSRRCKPPLPEEEVCQLLKSILLRERYKRSGRRIGGAADV